jgi:hypothetical protein
MKKYGMIAVMMLAAASWCHAAVIGINDFESYANTLELKAEWTNTANLTISLDTTEHHGGSKSMKFAYNNGASPYYSKSEYRLPGIEWGVSGQDWTGTTALSVWYKVTAAKEPLRIALVDCWGSTVYAQNFSAPLGDWKEAVCDLTAPDVNGHTLTADELTRIARIDLVMRAVNYGSGTIFFDDITRTVVPEPSTMILLGLGSLGLLRKRK